MKILIAGCGYLGTALAERLSSKGASVWALRRDWSKMLRMDGIEQLSADLLDPVSLANLPQTDFVIFCQAVSRPVDHYQITYYEGTKNLLSVVKSKIIFVSSTSVYGEKNGEWVDENSPAVPADGNAKILLETEKLVLSCDRLAIILRLGGIYGPGRNRLRAIKKGKIAADFSNQYANRIHVEDAVSALELLIQKGKMGEIYLGVDDAPATQREFYEWLFEKLGMVRPSGTWSGGLGKRCSNRKIKELGMKFQYPSFRDGYLEFTRC